ncbi:MAG: RsmB/NOP family class I SAM-dependent RNA methyltransferase [Alphaproteobacteria bacterium]
MKPASRIQAALEILEKLIPSRQPMDAIVGDYMRGRKYIGAKDRREVVELVYGVARHHARLGWWLEKQGQDNTPRNILIAYLALIRKTGTKRFSDLFDSSNYAPAELTQTEQELAENLQGQNLEAADMPVDVRVECPPAYTPKLQKYFGNDFEKEMAAMLSAATLDLRVNIFLLTREKARESLKSDEVEVDETPFSPWGLRAREKIFISKTKAFAKGLVEIQDEGSQLIAYVCDVKPGMQVLDYCAGGGGKTLALAAAMNRKGRIVAMDLDEKRLAKGRERYRKAQLADMIEVRPLSDEKQRKWLRRQKENFDVVLLDVPCTGTGTWRRNPDMRWNVYGPGLEELVAVQAEILEKAVLAVKPGGRVVYATCSLLSDENEEQVEKFLAAHPEFEIAPIENAALGNPFMRLTPLRHNTDGFFAAVLRKK